MLALSLGLPGPAMAAAGGIIYLRDAGGSVYAYLAMTHGDLDDRVSLTAFDDGTNTKQIISVGDTVWVLKNSGQERGTRAVALRGAGSAC